MPPLPMIIFATPIFFTSFSSFSHDAVSSRFDRLPDIADFTLFFFTFFSSFSSTLFHYFQFRRFIFDYFHFLRFRFFHCSPFRLLLISSMIATFISSFFFDTLYAPPRRAPAPPPLRR
jgi:hypothetical protein